MQILKGRWRSPVLIAAAFVFLLSGAVWYAKEYTTVGNSVYGREMPICSIETEKRQMSLTFETAWGEDTTGVVLDILKEEKVEAAFFVTEGWMREHLSLIKRMQSEGHDIGTLGVSHENLSVKTEKEQEKELEEALETAEKQGIRMELFRPPYGRYNDALIRLAQEKGMYTVCWSVDSMDWKNYGVRTFLQNVTENEEYRNGAIIRLNSETSDTAKGLKKLIEETKNRGFSFVKVTEMIYRDSYHMDVKGRQIRGMT